MFYQTKIYEFWDVIHTKSRIKLIIMWFNRSTNYFRPRKWETNALGGGFCAHTRKKTPVLCDQVTQCLASLTFSLVSATSTNDVPTIRGKKFWITHDRTRPPLGTSESSHLHLFPPKTDCYRNGRLGWNWLM